MLQHTRLNANQGVGQLIQMTIERSKAAKAGIQYGVCGEQGGEPNSVAFFHSVRVDLVMGLFPPFCFRFQAAAN